MNGLAERLERCEREIAHALAESQGPHTAMEHTGILLWEMDWRVERENILREITVDSGGRRPVRGKGVYQLLRSGA